MEQTSRLKLKIGAHEFEAEGPPDLVKEQLEAFRLLISTVPAAPPAAAVVQAPPPLTVVDESAQQMNAEASLARIMRVDDRVVSLTIRPRSVDEAVLLLLYGQKAMRANDSVTGAEIMDGLTATGVRVERADRLLEKAAMAGDVIVAGAGRAKRYRLSNAGLANARSVAAEHIANVA